MTIPKAPSWKAVFAFGLVWNLTVERKAMYDAIVNHTSSLLVILVGVGVAALGVREINKRVPIR